MAIQTVPRDAEPLIQSRFISYGTPDENELLDEKNEKYYYCYYLMARRSTSDGWFCQRVFEKIMEPYLDSKGSLSSILTGCFYMILVGIVLGLLVPSNNDLPTPWYRVMSNILGYSYFTFWCTSLYPQLILNFQRKSTEGLSNDYTIINLLGYLAYSVYTCAFYWKEHIPNMYLDPQERNGLDSNDTDLPTNSLTIMTVQSNDVAFAIHSLLITIIWTWQTVIYGGFKRDRGQCPVSIPMIITCALIIISCILYPALIMVVNDGSVKTYWLPLIVQKHLNWISYLYYLSYIKVVISVVKYPTQLMENSHHQSTGGWNIWNTVLDFAGGVFSLLQLVGDAIDLGDISTIWGNAAKFWLGLVSVLFCLLFFFQHYILYRDDTIQINGDIKNNLTKNQFGMIA